MSDLSRNAADLPIVIIGANTTGVATTPVGSDTNGNMLVKDYADGTPASAVPAVATQVGGSDGTNLRTLATDTSGKLKVDLNDGVGNAITSSSNANATPNQLIHVQTPDTSVASTALGALNANITIAMAGLASAGFQLAAGTLIGTLQPQCSIDGGTTWINCSFYNPSTSAVQSSLTFASANTLTVLSLLPIGGSSHVRVVVSAYTSGTANAVMRASQVTGAAGAITAAAFGTVNNTYITLTVNTTTLLLAANSIRKYAYISNNSGGTIAIQFGSATGLTSAARGLVIPNGNYYELKGDNLYTGAIYAYTNASGLVVAVTEGTP